MRRRFLTWLLLLAFGMQAPLALATADRAMELDCQTASQAQAAGMHGHMPCCPAQKTPLKCSVDGCLAGVSLLTAHHLPLALREPGQFAPTSLTPSKRFSSRGDSPLIRPPIL